MKNLLSPMTPVRSVIKIRPMAVGLLDKRKIRFWDSMDKPLGDILLRENLEDFLEEVSFARIPAEDADWTSLPLYFLVDYLTQGHRNFLLQDVADIAHLLDIHCLADSAETHELKQLYLAFQEFVKDFQAHLDEEESYLYPRILRYEACLKDNRVHPEFHRGSLQSHVSTRSSQESIRLLSICAGLAERAGRHAEQEPAFFAGLELQSLLEGFRDRLAAHVELKAKILYTAAREMEKNLYNLSIGGDLAAAQPPRGLMA